MPAGIQVILLPADTTSSFQPAYQRRFVEKPGLGPGHQEVGKPVSPNNRKWLMSCGEPASAVSS